VGEQDEARRGRVQRQWTADARDDRHGLMPGDPLEYDRHATVEHCQLRMLMRRLVEVLQERQRLFAKADAAGCERGELPQAQADLVPPVDRAFQQTLGEKFSDEPVRGRQGQAAASADHGKG
jgi:hypothetical protein